MEAFLQTDEKTLLKRWPPATDIVVMEGIRARVLGRGGEDGRSGVHWSLMRRKKPAASLFHIAFVLQAASSSLSGASRLCAAHPASGELLLRGRILTLSDNHEVRR